MPDENDAAEGSDVFGTVCGVPDLVPGFVEQFTSAHYHVNGIRLHAVTGGRGAPLLLVGGWPQFWWQWRAVMPQLASQFSVIAVDPRGFGLSEKPADGYDSATVGADLLGLMDQLGHRDFTLVGHDLGMWIAYAMAADAPHRVNRLALMEANLPGISVPPSALPDDGASIPRLWHFMFNRLSNINERLVEGREDIFFVDQFAVKGSGPTAMPKQAIDVYVRALRRPGALRACFNYYRALDLTIAQNRRRAATPLTMPVLAVGGATSRGQSVGEDVRKIATNVRSLSIPGCGHYIPEEAPDHFLSALSGFAT